MKQQTVPSHHFRPLADRVLLKRREGETSIGGILLPESAKKKQEVAEVVAIGPGKMDKNGQRIAIEVKIGDHVLIEKYGGQEVEIQGQEYTVVRAEEIIAIVEA